MHEEDFKQVDSIEDFGAKNYYVPKSFEAPMFSPFDHRIIIVLQVYDNGSIHRSYFPINIDKNFVNICPIEHLWITVFEIVKVQVVLRP